MAAEQTTDIALMSVHPKYAQAILDGRKKVEFRKSNFTKSVKEVVIYATSPIRKVIGTFLIKNIVEDDPKILWKKYGVIGEISRKDYENYYKDSERGVAILIERITSFESLKSLADFGVDFAPQSFVYVNRDAV